MKFPIPSCREPDSVLADKLKSIGHFVYHPNPGNIGDVLIAVASVQMFEKLGLSYEMYNEKKNYDTPFNLVYGGGGAMVPNWGYLGYLSNLFSNKNISQCIILPHSMRKCDELISGMDSRFTIFCREEKSYHYCRSINSTAAIFLSNDMACYMDIRNYLTWEDARKKLPRPGCITSALAGVFLPRHCKTRSLCRAYRKSIDRLDKHTRQREQHLPDGRKLLLAMRNDSEADSSKLPATLTNIPNVDVSRYGGSDCRWPEFNNLLVTQFIKTLDRYDIIITDRLHVSIASILLGKQVIMIDNNYGKLSGVWQQSLSHFDHCHMCCNTSDIESSLNHLHIELSHL